MYLLPVPQIMEEYEGSFCFSYDDKIVISDLFSSEFVLYAQWLKKEIEKSTGFELEISRSCGEETGAIRIQYREGMEDQEYRIRISEKGVELTASHPTGILYGIQTMTQMIEQEGAVLPCLFIHDYPEIKTRGYFYDVTRGRIPTMDFLKKWIDLLAKYKYNQFQLYMEHTFLFRGMSEVWRDDTPITAEEILELDEYCAERNIELVPSIATFGHLYKVLRTRTYRHLCEREDLADAPFGFVDRMEHHTLDTSNEESFLLVKRLMDEFIPLFRSDKFNLCGDETFDLGKGKSRKLLEEMGEAHLYLGFVGKLCGYLISKGKQPMLWGDIICKFPEAVDGLPRQAICLNWGYDGDVTGENTRKLAEAGVHFYNCPGVNGWDQFVNRIRVSYDNISKMCSYARKYHGEGILNTDWGDCGHVNHPDMSIIGLIYGAEFSWNRRDMKFEDLNQRISAVEYLDKRGGFVALLSDLSELWKYKWRNLVNCKEGREPAWGVETIPQLKAAENALRKKREALMGYIPQMDGTKKDAVRPYLIAVDGMILLQQIGTELACIHRGDAKAERKTGDQLAGRLESWFYYYKTEWRKTSRESELYRVQEVIFWAADCLRQGKIRA